MYVLYKQQNLVLFLDENDDQAKLHQGRRELPYDIEVETTKNKKQRETTVNENEDVEWDEGGITGQWYQQDARTVCSNDGDQSDIDCILSFDRHQNSPHRNLKLKSVDDSPSREFVEIWDDQFDFCEKKEDIVAETPVTRPECRSRLFSCTRAKQAISKGKDFVKAKVAVCRKKLNLSGAVSYSIPLVQHTAQSCTDLKSANRIYCCGANHLSFENSNLGNLIQGECHSGQGHITQGHIESKLSNSFNHSAVQEDSDILLSDDKYSNVSVDAEGDIDNTISCILRQTDTLYTEVLGLEADDEYASLELKDHKNMPGIVNATSGKKFDLTEK